MGTKLTFKILDLPPTWSLLALFCLWISGTFSACGKGCISCDTTKDSCLICDPFEKYQLDDEGNCTQVTADNCKVGDPAKGEFQCLQCNKNMIFDSTQKKCVDVPGSKKILDCVDYNQGGECVACAENHYISNGNCLPAAIEVEDCLVFTEASFCSVCARNKRFDEDTGKCVDFTSVSNCGIHAFMTCDRCLKGFYLGANSLYSFANTQTPNTSFVVFLNTDPSFTGNFNSKAISNCLPALFDNCLTNDVQDGKMVGCATCSPGYYLDAGTKHCVLYPAVQITNCQFYTNSSTCYRCVATHWLNGNQCDPVDTVPDCQTYHRTENKCEVCIETHYIDSTGKTCTARNPYPIASCTTHTTDADECTTCADTLRKTGDNKKCLPSIPNCRDYVASTTTDTALKCDICNTNYYPSSDQLHCLVQNIPNCLTYETNKASCDTCLDGFYKDGTTLFTCSKKQISGCKEYVTAQENKCENCHNLFSKATDNLSCIALTDLKCAENDPNTTTCIRCNNSSYLDSGGVCQDKTKTIDPLCTKTTDDGVCVECVYDYIPFKLNGYLENLPANCAAADASTGACTQCDVDKDGSDDSGNLACANAASTTGKCRQLAANVKEALTDNDSKCALCRDQTAHYLTGNTCTDRSGYKKHNCGSLNPIADSCNTCSEGFHLVQLSDKSADCLNVPTVFTHTNIDNCEVHDFYNDGKCLRCKNGFTYTAGVGGSADTCPPTTGDAPNDWDWAYIDFKDSMNVEQGLPFGQSAIANCAKHYYSYTSNELRCSQCKDTFTPVVQYNDNSNNELSVTEHGFIFSDLYNIKACRAMNNGEFMRVETATAMDIAANCGSVIDYNDFASGTADNYICTSCKEGFVGIVKQFNFDKAGNDATTWANGGQFTDRLGYASCTPTSEMTRTLKPVYTMGENAKNLNFREILYDTCSDATKNVVHIRAYDNFFYDMAVEGPTGSERVNSVCQVIPAASKIDNCQVYTLEPSTDASRDLALDDTYKCMTCKPGHSFPDGKDREQCLPIQNCNLSGTNTYMNGCETCDTNFSWELEVDGSDRDIRYDKCIANKITTETNCLVSKSDGECLLCKNGKTLNLDTKECDDYPSFCATQGMPMHNLTQNLPASGSELNKYQALMVVLYNDKYKTAPSLCASCSGSLKLFMASTSDASKNVCVANQIQRNTITGCKIYSATSRDICITCNDEYILRQNDGQCILRENTDTYENCKYFSSGTSCGLCKDGYVKHFFSDYCINDHNCKTPTDEVTANNYCSECNHGYNKHPTKPRECLKVTDDSSPCLSFVNTSSNSYCQKCKDCTQTPIRKFTGSSETNVYCVNNDPSYVLDGYLLKYEENPNYHIGTYSTLLKPIPSGKYLKTTFEAGSSMAEYVCVRGPIDRNCATFDTSNKYECDTCKSGYYLDTDSKRCMWGSIEGCMTYSSSSACLTCYTTPSKESNWKAYYKLGSRCYLNTSTNCAGYGTSSNTCNTCKNGYHRVNSLCVVNKLATNCKLSTTNTDTCVTCANKYYRNGSGFCEAHTVSNCSSYDSTANRCSGCNEGYYSSNSSCLENTAPNCKTKSQSSNACSECNNPNEYSDGMNGCVAQPEMTGCKTYRTSSLGCLECNEGFFISGSTCVANPTGLSDCVTYTSATTCTTCANTHFFDGTKCTVLTSTVLNCAVYSADGVCSSCDSGHLLSATGDACTAVESHVTNCATWTDISNCATCSGNFVLATNTDSKSICESSGIDHCLVAVAGTPNTCSSCADGFILRDGTCVSPKISIQNCRLYEDPSEDCVECYPGNVLSADKRLCLSRIAEAGDQCALAHIKSDEKPTCNVCQFGYSMNADGTCSQCGGDGCFVCDTSDLTKCKVCATSYYMSSSGTCSLNNPPEPEFSEIARVFSALILLLLVFKLE